MALIRTGGHPACSRLVQSLREAGVNVVLGGEVNVDRIPRNPGTPLQMEVGDVNGLSMLDSTPLAQAQTAIDAIRGKETYFVPRWTPRCVYTSPQMAAVGWMKQEAIDAGLDITVGSERTELLADEELKVLDRYPTRIKVVLEARTKKFLGCLAIGDQAVDVVNLCSMLLRSDTPPDELNRCRFVHPSPAEALQRCMNEAVNQVISPAAKKLFRHLAEEEEDRQDLLAMGLSVQEHPCDVYWISKSIHRVVACTAAR